MEKIEGSDYKAWRNGHTRVIYSENPSADYILWKDTFTKTLCDAPVGGSPSSLKSSVVAVFYR